MLNKDNWVQIVHWMLKNPEIGLKIVGAFNNIYKFDKSVAYLAMWKQDAWLDTHLQADIARDRFAKLAGTIDLDAELVTDDLGMQNICLFQMIHLILRWLLCV